jgi:hypothetical protein
MIRTVARLDAQAALVGMLASVAPGSLDRVPKYSRTVGSA